MKTLILGYSVRRRVL